MVNGNRKPVLGIDLGTSTCLAGVWDEQSGQMIMIKPEPHLEQDWMPSVFCLTDESPQPLVGEAAYQMLRDHRYAGGVIRCVKRFMNRPNWRQNSGGRSFTAQDVSAAYLGHLRRAAIRQLHLPDEPLEAVVTVPAYFGNQERRLTYEAAEKADLIPHLLDEPIAAAYGLNLHNAPGRQLALVLDLGGGTLDVTLILAGTSVPQGIYELGRDGDDQLGGDLWDDNLAKLLVFKQDHQRDSEFFDWNNIQLYEPCEKAKRNFSTLPVPSQTVAYIDRTNKRTYYPVVSREEFLHETDYLAEKCVKICERLMSNIPNEEMDFLRKQKGLLSRLFGRAKQPTWKEIDRVYLVGGGSKMRQVIDKMSSAWGRPLEVEQRPQHQIVYGAARIGARVREDKSFFEHMHLRSPHAVGYLYRPKLGGQPTFECMIERNATIPRRTEVEIEVGGGGRNEFEVEIAEERLEMIGRDHETVLKLKKLTTVRISELNSPRESRNRGFFSMYYSADRELKFTAKVGGKEVMLENIYEKAET